MSSQQYDSVWDAIEQTPEEAENMKLRSKLMIQLQRYIDKTGLSQVEAAHMLGVTQPRIADLMRGKINLFSIDTLVNMAAAAKLRGEIQLLEAP